MKSISSDPHTKREYDKLYAKTLELVRLFNEFRIRPEDNPFPKELLEYIKKLNNFVFDAFECDPTPIFYHLTEILNHINPDFISTEYDLAYTEALDEARHSMEYSLDCRSHSMKAKTVVSSSNHIVSFVDTYTYKTDSSHLVMLASCLLHHTQQLEHEDTNEEKFELLSKASNISQLAVQRAKNDKESKTASRTHSAIVLHRKNLVLRMLQEKYRLAYDFLEVNEPSVAHDLLYQSLALCRRFINCVSTQAIRQYLINVSMLVNSFLQNRQFDEAEAEHTQATQTIYTYIISHSDGLSELEQSTLFDRLSEISSDIAFYRNESLVDMAEQLYKERRFDEIQAYANKFHGIVRKYDMTDLTPRSQFRMILVHAKSQQQQGKVLRAISILDNFNADLLDRFQDLQKLEMLQQSLLIDAATTFYNLARNIQESNRISAFSYYNKAHDLLDKRPYQTVKALLLQSQIFILQIELVTTFHSKEGIATLQDNILLLIRDADNECTKATAHAYYMQLLDIINVHIESSSDPNIIASLQLLKFKVCLKYIELSVLSLKDKKYFWAIYSTYTALKSPPASVIQAYRYALAKSRTSGLVKRVRPELNGLCSVGILGFHRPKTELPPASNNYFVTPSI
jgi:hypothetical protein